MRIDHLRIEQREAPLAQACSQRHQRDFRAAALATEHRFAAEQSADRHAVDATDQVAAIDTGLLELLHRVNATLGTSRPFQVISGYRSPASNQMLSSHSSGVAKHSLHMEGKAIDIRLPGIPLADLHRAGLMLKGGGVGYYPGSNFVQLDVGRVRTWVG